MELQGEHLLLARRQSPTVSLGFAAALVAVV
jgi:hypothetical protein